MTSVASKIASLVARATHESTPIEEARTSAWVALKLMKQHGGEIVIGRPKLAFSPAMYRTYETDSAWDKEWSPPGPAQSPPKPKKPRANRTSKVTGNGPAKVDEKDIWRRITNKFWATCIACQKRLDVGNSVFWRHGHGVACPECHAAGKVKDG